MARQRRQRTGSGWREREKPQPAGRQIDTSGWNVIPAGDAAAYLRVIRGFRRRSLPRAETVRGGKNGWRLNSIIRASKY